MKRRVKKKQNGTFPCLSVLGFKLQLHLHQSALSLISCQFLRLLFLSEKDNVSIHTQLSAAVTLNQIINWP